MMLRPFFFPFLFMCPKAPPVRRGAMCSTDAKANRWRDEVHEQSFQRLQMSSPLNNTLLLPLSPASFYPVSTMVLPGYHGSQLNSKQKDLPFLFTGGFKLVSLFNFLFYVLLLLLLLSLNHVEYLPCKSL